MLAASAPKTSRFPRLCWLVRLTVVTGHGGLALTLAAAGTVVTNPFGVERQGGDSIAGIKSLTPAEARQLVAKRTDATARIATGKPALGTFAGNKSGGGKLNLFGLTSLDAESARGLAAFRGKLELDGLTEIDAEAAAALATYNGPRLSLRGLKSLSADAAGQLAKANSWDRRLSSLKRVSPKALAALIEGQNIELPPVESLELIEEPDRSCTDDFVIPENFPTPRPQK